MAKTRMTPVERAIQQKRRTLARMKEDIRVLRAECAAEVAKIERRMRVAETILTALENGSLEP